MSDDAVRYVKAFTHPLVTEAALAVLAAIAQLIPDGETTTPLIGMGDIAKLARVHRRTVWKWIVVLVEIGEVRVVDGLPGRPARYTLVHLVGVGPLMTAPLPLRADLQPVRRRLPATTPDLFDEAIAPITREETAIGSQVSPITRITRITGWTVRTITRITGWRPFRRTATCDPCDPCDPDTCDPCDPALPLDVDLTRARDRKEAVLQEEPAAAFRKEEAGPRPEPPVNERDVAALLAWWREVFPVHRAGAQYILRPWDRAKAAKLLQGRTLAHVHEMVIAAMTMTPDGRKQSRDWLATCQDFSLSAVLWKATFLDEEIARRQQAAAAIAEAEARAAERAALEAEREAARVDTAQAAETAYTRLSEPARAQLEREARDALAEYRPRMRPDAFEVKVQVTMRSYLEDPRVRERFGVDDHPGEKYG